MQIILTDIDLGKNIKKIRKKKGFTQEYIVTQMQLYGSSMSRNTLSNIETGRRNIKASDLRILKMVLGVSYDEFFV